jgi:hypothetical protein
MIRPVEPAARAPGRPFQQKNEGPIGGSDRMFDRNTVEAIFSSATRY